MRRAWQSLGIVVCIITVLSSAAQADFASQRAVLKQLDFEQRMGNKVPMDVGFTNQDGEAVTLRSLASDKPILLNMVYYECPMLCTMVLNGVLKALRVTPLNVYEDFDIVTISINPAKRLIRQVRRRGIMLANTIGLMPKRAGIS